MTGPAEGKLKIEAHVYLNGEPLDDVDVYIHLKGHSLARVTHLDIEHPRMNELLRPNTGRFLKILGTEIGFVVDGKSWHLVVKSPVLKGLFNVGEESYAWVGGKVGGIYIGFKKRYVEKLEEKALKLSTTT
ncbi:MAG: hypothetical protein QW701_02790 [Candidatus Nezhaarchaeales archaeon]